MAQRFSDTINTGPSAEFCFPSFAMIAVLIASAGLYAVIAHSVGKHAQEIVIWTAIDATVSDVTKLVVKQGTLPVAIGLTIGLAASFAFN